jgi:F-type H+-transporting ATPase subunit b
MRGPRPPLLTLLPLLALALFAAGPARAQDHGGPPAAGGHGAPAAGAPKGGGDEPPIFTPVRIDLGIWTLVVFLVLFAFLSRYAWGPMLEGLRKREQNIHDAVAEAAKARDEAHRLREEFQRDVAAAQQRARDIVEEARRNAARAAEEDRAKAKAEIQAERERLHREIDLARDQALQQIWSQTAQLAALVSAKTIRRKLSPDDHRALVDEAIAELKQAEAGARGNGRAAEV